jgi:hypothetical protein
LPLAVDVSDIPIEMLAKTINFIFGAVINVAVPLHAY